MDELFVLEEEAQAAQSLVTRAEDEAAAGHWSQVTALVGKLVVLWREALVPQMERVLAPQARREGLEMEVAEVLDAAERVGDRLGALEEELHDAAPAARTALEAHRLLEDVRVHVSALLRGVLPRIYGGCTDDELWELARALDRMVDELGRARWRVLVSAD